MCFGLGLGLGLGLLIAYMLNNQAASSQTKHRQTTLAPQITFCQLNVPVFVSVLINQSIFFSPNKQRYVGELQ